jgi:single-stranded-DNA-specific exonuclease
VEAARAFLSPDLASLHDPFALPDMAAVVARLDRALTDGEPLLVHGDYDADGVTSTALMVRALSKLGGRVHYYVPHRMLDHYGLASRAIRLAVQEGLKLIVALDCGVSDHEAIAEAQALGIEVLVIDHHQPGPQLPAETLVVNPKRSDSEYPFADLSAVGLGYKVLCGLCQQRGLNELSLARAFLDLVCVGTIADVMPLRDENRILCAAGLKLLPQTRKAGLRALMNLCDLNGTASASDVAFRLAPRLNAVGRMGDANEAVQLLVTEDEDEAVRLALLLDSLNRQRQREQERVYQQARSAAVTQLELTDRGALVLAGEGWHAGVVGIVASKILEEFGRPAVVLTHDEGLWRGSGRSLPGFDMAQAFASCHDLLLRYGGHELAGGLTLEATALEPLRERLAVLATEQLAEGVGQPRLEVDGEVGAEELTPELAEALSALEPCGQDNRPPLLLTRGLEVLDVRTVGREGSHLKLTLAAGQRAFDAIGFGLGGRANKIASRQRLDVVHTPEINEFNGNRGLQLRLTDLRPAETP